ncbi:MAG: EAL domain-containing protein [Sulfuricella sp.]|nr:EAL domain-containing protein [Sulfuricella sp.]
MTKHSAIGDMEIALLKKFTVLYVEDDGDIRDQLAHFLKRRVGTLHVATNGQEGLEAFQAHRPDIVVTDILMPVMDGLKMAEQIKELSPATPIIVTTAFNETKFFLHAIDIGIDKYVIKPVNTDLLAEVLAQCAHSLLSESERRLSAAVFDNSSDAIVVTDQKNCIISVNPAFSEITGYTREEVIGKNPKIFSAGRQSPEFYTQMWHDLSQNSKWSGEIWNRRKGGELYPEWLSINTVRDNQGEITHFVGIFSDITERKQAEERVRHLAHYDALTDLPNRTLFHDRLQQALIQAQRNHEQVAVMFIDLDRFKVINDTLGHGIGDLLLQSVAQRLAHCVRQGDTVCRQGGDEFVILLPKIYRAEDAALVAQKILQSIGKPFSLDGHELHISSSIGISFFPSDGVTVDVLMKNADVAMYRAKELGRNNYQFYLADMNARSFERLALETSLRRALEHHELELYFQPLMEANGQTMIGLEALVRWNHPDLGLVHPSQFIALAEETGLIVPIGEWVLRTACRQGKLWLDEGYRPLRMSVNLSPRQFHQSDFLGIVRAILDETGFDPHWLEMEVTESMLMQNTEDNIVLLKELKALGISIAVDDFGTGYSSLSYLKRLPIDTLKIDRSFVGDLNNNRDDAAIVDAIISLAQSLSLKVIAEGVEKQEQQDFLREHHCNEMQGFLFSHPLPAAQFIELLKLEK